MSKIIAVTGATGSQGGGVVNVMKNTPGWKVRAITRNVGSEAAKKLAAEGIEVVSASFDDESSLVAAFEVSMTADKIVTRRMEAFSLNTDAAISGCQRCLCRYQLVGTSVQRKDTRRIELSRRRPGDEAGSCSSSDSNIGALYLVELSYYQEASQWRAISAARKNPYRWRIHQTQFVTFTEPVSSRWTPKPKWTNESRVSFPNWPKRQRIFSSGTTLKTSFISR